jgi:hypothetical protein
MTPGAPSGWRHSTSAAPSRIGEMFRPFYAAGGKVTFSASEDGIQRDLTAQAHLAMAENLLTRVARN